MQSLFRAAAFFTLTLWAAPLSAQSFDIPPNDGFVTDAAGLLSASEEQQIESDLDAYARETSNEIAVLIVPSLSGAVIGDVAVEIGRDWGVGSSKNNGILILVSYADREVFIATGYGLEGAIPDIVAYGIINEDVVPQFRDGDFAAGIAQAIDSLKKHIGGEYTAERYEQEEGAPGFAWIIFLLFIFADFMGAFLSRSKSWWLGGVLGAIFGLILTALFSWWVTIPVLTLLGLLFDYIVSKNGGGRGGRGGRNTPWSGFGSGGSGSSSSGGFGGFSGGLFGGGGAGGKW